MMGPAEWFLCIKQVDESKHKAAISKDINSICHLCESWEERCLVIYLFFFGTKDIHVLSVLRHDQKWLCFCLMSYSQMALSDIDGL